VSDPLETVPGQLDTILEALDTMKVRLEDGDRRMNDADRARGQMHDKLDVHGLMLTDQSQHLNEQDRKLDALGGAIEKLTVAMAANTEITTTVKDALTTARVGRKVLIWLGGIAGAAGTLWGAWHTIFPHDITPK
jgi:hypothetical protein